MLPDGHINPEGMNSLNHYTFGSIAGWLVSYLCGIRPAEPGYRKAILEPKPDKRLGEACVTIETAAGKYECGWKYDGEEVKYQFKVPFGATAELRLPGEEAEIISSGTYKI